MRLVPLSPKSSHNFPVLASRAISRASTVPMNNRAEHVLSSCGCGCIFPIRDPPASVLIARIAIGGNLGVIAPFLFARSGVNRDHLVKLCAKDQRAFHQNRRRLQCSACETASSLLPSNAPLLMGPGDLKADRHYLGVDLLSAAT